MDSFASKIRRNASFGTCRTKKLNEKNSSQRFIRDMSQKKFDEKLSCRKKLNVQTVWIPLQTRSPLFVRLSGCHTCRRSAVDRMSNTRIHPRTLCCSDGKFSTPQSQEICNRAGVWYSNWADFCRKQKGVVSTLQILTKEPSLLSSKPAHEVPSLQKTQSVPKDSSHPEDFYSSQNDTLPTT